MPLIMIVSAFAALVGYGGAPRASIFMGKKDKESAEKTLGNCFMLQIIISIILTAVLLIWNRDFLMAFGASENTIEYGVSYMNIYALGTIFVEITLGMNAFITAQGFAKTGMLSVLIGAVANIILDPIFIFGFDMDVRGAALATIISQALSCIWVVSFLCGKKTFLKIKRKNLGFTPQIILPCLALGVATFIMQASESVISVCFNSSLQNYGGDDDPDKCHAVRDASSTGTGTGSTADHQLLLRRRRFRKSAGGIQASAQSQPVLFRAPVAACHAPARRICSDVYI